jgi:hypothetical protein
MLDTPASRLLDLATEIAVYAPKRQGQNVHTAGISWRLIHELREALDAMGIDWRAAKARDDEAKARVHAQHRVQP